MVVGVKPAFKGTAQHSKLRLRLQMNCQATRSIVLAEMVFKQPSFSPSRDVSPMVTTSPTLPADVVRLILEAVHVTHDYTLWDEYGHRARVAWFASMIRMSRMCYIAGQEALYHRIKIVARNERSNDLLIRTWIRKPHIAQMVKALYIQSPHDRVRYCKVDSHRRSLFPIIHSIPFATHDWRKDWHATWQQKKSVQLLRLCTAVTELSLEQPDLALLTPLLDSTRFSIDRLTIVGIQDVTFHQWESLSQATFWRNLRSIRLLAVDPEDGSSLHNTSYNLDIAFLGVRPFTRLKELRIVGYVEPLVLRRIVNVVRPTLTTLQCDQTNDISAMCISLTSATLRSLVLSVSPFWPLADLSLFTRLEHLTLILCPELYHGRSRVGLRLSRNLPSSISVFELHIHEWYNHLDPWRTASALAQVLRAFDIGILPNLRCIVVSVKLWALNELGSWAPAAFLLTGAAKRRGLEFRLDIRFTPQYGDAYRFDCFARARLEPTKAGELEQAELDKCRGPPVPGVRVLGLLSTVTLAYFVLLSFRRTVFD